MAGHTETENNIEQHLAENEEENLISSTIMNENDKDNILPDESPKDKRISSVEEGGTEDRLMETPALENPQLENPNGDGVDNSENDRNEPQPSSSKENVASSDSRLFKLPLTRIKAIIKMDPEVTLASQEAVVSIAKATV